LILTVCPKVAALPYHLHFSSWMDLVYLCMDVLLGVKV
jgi:hypothetical protein